MLCTIFDEFELRPVFILKNTSLFTSANIFVAHKENYFSFKDICLIPKISPLHIEKKLHL